MLHETFGDPVQTELLLIFYFILGTCIGENGDSNI